MKHFAFPLKGAQFPGVAYTGAHVGLGVHVPLHRFIGLHVEGGLRPGLKPGNEAAKLLGTAGSGLGYTVGGGLTSAWHLLSVGLQGRLEGFSVQYKGQSALEGTPTSTSTSQPVQFTDLKLRDRLVTIQLTLGIAY
jgi:hypothetical protein